MRLAADPLFNDIEIECRRNQISTYLLANETRSTLTALSRDICQFLGRVRKPRVGVEPNKSLYQKKSIIS